MMHHFLQLLLINIMEINSITNRMLLLIAVATFVLWMWTTAIAVTISLYSKYLTLTQPSLPNFAGVTNPNPDVASTTMPPLLLVRNVRTFHIISHL